MKDEIPEFIGKYKIKEKIAEGGMGIVYKALHPSLKREIVIKKMTQRSNQKARERFKKEAQILLDMQSPYIVHLFDYFTEGPYRYMVEEFVDGLALDDLIKKQTVVDPMIALLILQDACFALKFAHKRKIIHRDIKPGNILISKKAEVKLADFGIASDENDTESEKTQENVTLGTPAYMPPEQFENSSAVDARADIYALGIMLYEMVTGTKPYPNEYTLENIAKIKKGKYIKPQKIDKTLPHVVCKLIKKMIKPKAKNRFSNVDQILKIIKNYLKNYDTHSIRVELAKCILSKKPYKVAVFSKKKNPWKTGVIIFTTCAILGAFGFSLYKNGFFHKYLLKNLYTPVTLSLKMPVISSPASQISAQAIFFKFEENDQIIEQIENSERVFSQGEIAKNGVTVKRLGAKNQNYITRPVYLMPGEYRVKIVIGSSVWWKSFSVEKNSFKNHIEKIIQIDDFNQQKRNLVVKLRSFDEKTLEEISSKTKFTVLYKNRWVALDSIPPQTFLSNEVWKFRAECENYDAEIFSLMIDWYQDTVYCNFNLKRK